MIRKIKSFFIFIYKDLKSDFEFLHRLFTNNLHLEEKEKINSVKQVYRSKNLFMLMIKRYWLFLLVLVLAWVSGLMIGMLYGEYQANLQLYNILYENQHAFIQDPELLKAVINGSI